MSADVPPDGPRPGFRPPTVDVGRAFGWAWQKFRANTATLIVGAVVMLVIFTAVYVAAVVIAHDVTGGSFFLSTDRNTGQPKDIGSYLANLGVMYAILFAASIPLSVLTASYVRVGLRIADGQTPGIGSFFSLRDAPRIMLTSVMLSICSLIGLVLCYLPGLVFGAFATFTLAVVIDKGQSPVAALRSSFALVRTNFWPIVGVTLLAGLVAGGGFLVCLVGALVSLPVAMLVHVYVYRFVSGGPISD